MKTILIFAIVFFFSQLAFGQNIEFETVQASDYEPLQTQAIFITSEKDISALPQSFAETARKINFKENAALFIALGERHSGGYDFEIVESVCKKKHLRIKYREIKPDKNAMVSMAFTYPAKLFLLKKAKCKKYSCENITHD
jgi:hypothetical protein